MGFSTVLTKILWPRSSVFAKHAIDLLAPIRLVVILCLFPILHPAPAAAAESPAAIEKQYTVAVAYYHNIRFHGDSTQEQWQFGIRLFQRIYRSAPNHIRAPDCIFAAARLYHERYHRFGNLLDLSEAIAYFDDLLMLYPSHHLADDALFHIGRINLLDQKDSQRAASSFIKLLLGYPAGDMAAKARSIMEKELPGYQRTARRERQPVRLTPPKRLEIVTRTTRTARTPAPQQTQTAAATILPIAYWSTEAYTRVVIEASATVPFTRKLIPPAAPGDPYRLLIHLQQSVLDVETRQSIAVKDGLLQQINLLQAKDNAVAVQIDTEAKVLYRLSVLEDPFRIIVDVKNDNRRTAPRRPPPSLAQQLGLKIKRVVVDPGHGGKDPGAINTAGMQEKEITLAIGRRLAAQLIRRLGCEVIMTRNDDSFLPLEKRTVIANSQDGDLLISIHVNSAPNSKARGIETYFLNLATSEEETRAAAKENASSTRQISDLQAILMDIMQNSKIDESARLADKIQQQVVAELSSEYDDVNNLGVKQAPFIVLIGAQMPAILIETGFISNSREAGRLQDGKYLDALADAITAGIIRYVTDQRMAAI